MPISKPLLYLQENKEQFLKVRPFFSVRMTKIVEIGQIFPAEKRDWKASPTRI